MLAQNGLIQIWPDKGREGLAKSLGAFEKDGSFYLDPNRKDENAQKLKRLFGTEVARRAREAAVIAQTQGKPEAPTTVQAAETAAPRGKLSLKTAKTAEATDRINADGSDGAVEPVITREPSLNALLFEEPSAWRWTDSSLLIGGVPGATFMPVRAVMIPGAEPRLEITVDTDSGTGAPARSTITIRVSSDVKNVQKALDQALRRYLEDPALRARALKAAADLHATPAEEEQAAKAANSAAHDGQALLDLVLATAGGAKGPAIVWLGENLDRPATAARTGMRGVVTSASIAPGNAGSQTLKLVIDYRGFMTENAAIAAAAKTKAPGAFETVPITASPAEGEGLSGVAAKLARTFRQVDAPKSELSPGTKTAAKERETDERLHMAEMANAEVARHGITPPAPIPPVNNDENATRVYFWAAREPESPYYYKKILEAAKAAGVPVMTDRTSGSPHWGLRFIEATRAEVAALPESMTFFLTEQARQAHLASKARVESSRNLVKDAAATAAIEVTTKRDAEKMAKTEASAPAEAPAAANTNQSAAKPEPGARPAVTESVDTGANQLRPLTVPHPQHDREGWFRARAAIFNIAPERLIQIVDLTVKMYNELEIEKDMKRTIGEDVSQDDLTRLASWRHGINLGKEGLLRRGVKYEEPEKRAQKANPAVKDAIAMARSAEPATRSQHERQPAQIER